MIYKTVKPLVLASNSPRRREYLRELGLDFIVQAEEIDETPLPAEQPETYVERMARAKARGVSCHCPDSYVLAADTAVCIDSRILGKPRDSEDAVAMLLALAGKEHIVRSGICISCESAEFEIVRSVATRVTFVNFSEEAARGYVATGEPHDKAGAYGIQGRGAFLVERLEGSYTNVVGLPLAEVVAILEKIGVIAPAGRALQIV